MALFHADVQEVEGLLEAVQGPGELILRGPARAFLRLGPRLGEGLDGGAGAVDPPLDLVEVLARRVLDAEGVLDPAEGGDAAAERIARGADGLEVGADPADRVGPRAGSPPARRGGGRRPGRSDRGAGRARRGGRRGAAPGGSSPPRRPSGRSRPPCPTLGRTCSTTQRSTRASRSSERR
jgi:hypothetical protein